MFAERGVMVGWVRAIPVAVILLFLSVFVLAAHIVTYSANEGTSFNVNEDLTFFVNVTVNNTDAGGTNITNVSITIPSSFTAIVNSSNGSDAANPSRIFRLNANSLTFIWNNETLWISNGSLTSVNRFWINVTAATPGIYNITVETGFNTTLVRNTNLTIRVNDTVVPSVETGNITTPLAGGNYSGTLKFNVSVGDNSLVSAVLFNITNASGQVLIVDGSQLGSSWNGSLTTSLLTDGAYNVTIFANDTYGSQNLTTHFGGNLNNSARIEIKIDNTAPVLSVSCTPSTVYVGETTTCSCSATDATSGVNTSFGTNGVSITANPSTQNTGSQSTPCNSVDLAGNSASLSANYNVESSGTAVGGAGTGGSSSSIVWTATYSVTNEALQRGETRDLGVKKRLKVMIANEDHYVGVAEISANTAKIVVSSTPQEVSMSAGETKKFEVTGDKFYDLQVTLESVSGSMAKVTVRAIYEEIPDEEIGQGTGGSSGGTTGIGSGAGESSSSGSSAIYWMIGIIIVIVIVVVVIVMRNRK